VNDHSKFGLNLTKTDGARTVIRAIIRALLSCAYLASGRLPCIICPMSCNINCFCYFVLLLWSTWWTTVTM